MSKKLDRAVQIEAIRIAATGALPEWLKFGKATEWVRGEAGVWIRYSEDVKNWLRENGSKRL